MGVNKEFFTCIGRGHGAPCLPATREDWERMRREPWLAQMCERIVKGDEELKHRLPVWTPHCAEFRNNHRAIADALKPLNRLMLDFDEKGHTEEIIGSLTPVPSPKGRGETETPANGTDLIATPTEGGLEKALTVLLVEESVRGGTHVLVELPEGMTADEAQELMEQATGFKPDKAVKDVSRCIYMVPYDHTRYVSERLFEVSPPPPPPEGRGASTSNVNTSSSPSGETRQTSSVKLPPTFKGVPYTDIISEWWRRNGGEPAEGERNVKLHKLAVNLRAICDNKKEVLMAVMPRLGLSELELKSIVDSACKETPKGVSKMMNSIVDTLLTESTEETEDTEENTTISTLNTKLKNSLPIGLRESLVGVPKNMQMPVLCSVMPMAATYADQVSIKYCDGMEQHLGMMSIILGDQASGKSVCKNAVDVWKRQLDEEDALARKREEEWKERKKSRKANEKAPEDPKVLIRVLPVTVSCSTLLKRFKNSNGHTLYSFGEELDTLRKTNGAGSWSSKYDIYRLSFDRGEWGQDYNSDQAESGVVRVAYNWTMLGTYGAMRKCFKADNIENGLSSRILVAEMPDSSFAKMPKYGKRTLEDEAKIQEAVNVLRKSNGLIDTPRLRKAIEDWVEEKRVESAKDIDRVKDTYRKRAAVIGFRCGVIFHLLTGKEKETQPCIDFALMMAEYCLQEQIKAFGEALQSQYQGGNTNLKNKSNKSVFEQLPSVFTIDDLRALKEGICNDISLRKIVSRWLNDGWIKKINNKHWEKV